MKDIQKIKIWPFLKEKGFELKDYKAGKRTIARGAYLTLKGYLKLEYTNANNTIIEIEPVENNRYRVTYDFPLGNTETNYLTAWELNDVIPIILKKYESNKTEA